MKVAVVHEWLVTWAGAERVLSEILALFPQADLFVLFDRLPKSQRYHLPRDPKGETFLSHIPHIEKLYRNLLPVMPAAIESLDLASYDLILSSSHSVGKGVRTHPGQIHLCYCHTPPRYLWDLTEVYFSATLSGRLKRLVASFVFPWLKRWDVAAGQHPDAIMANSRFVAERILRIYGRISTVIYPPVDIDRFELKKKGKGDYFVTLGRLVPYKNIDRLAHAFQGSPHKLVIVGDGPGRKGLEEIIKGHTNIEWYPWVSDKEWGRILLKARAFLFMAEEDFGIAPVEAMAAGVPVIAWGKGGILETVKGFDQNTEKDLSSLGYTDASGLFFDEPTPKSLTMAIARFIAVEEYFDPLTIRQNAERFSRKAFRERYAEFVRDHCATFAALPKGSE